MNRDNIEVGDRVRCIFDLGVARDEIGKEGIIEKISGPYPDSPYKHLHHALICRWRVDGGRLYYSANIESFTLVKKGRPQLVNIMHVPNR